MAPMMQGLDQIPHKETSLSVLEEVRQLIKHDVDQLNVLIEQNLQANVDLIPQVIHHIVDSGGKRLRPLLTLLIARSLGYQGEAHVKLAAIIEFIHTATLLHDDVVDVSEMRRGRPTANVIWGNSAGILVGDFLYSRAFQMINSLHSWQISDILANTTNIIAEGEALQLINRHNPDVSEDYYFEMIRRKTAVLFAAATQLGAVVAGVPASTEQAIYHYGLHLGLGFQIMDDFLDYMVTSEEMGKNAGDDFVEGKVTLPLIYAIKYASKAEADMMRNAIRRGNSLQDFEVVVSIIRSTPAVQEIHALAQKEIQTAKNMLEVLPAGDYKDALMMLADLAVHRRS